MVDRIQRAVILEMVIWYFSHSPVNPVSIVEFLGNYQGELTGGGSVRHLLDPQRRERTGRVVDSLLVFGLGHGRSPKYCLRNA